MWVVCLCVHLLPVIGSTSAWSIWAQYVYKQDMSLFPLAVASLQLGTETLHAVGLSHGTEFRSSLPCPDATADVPFSAATHPFWAWGALTRAEWS